MFYPRRLSTGSLSAIDTGLAHHKFLQHFGFETPVDPDSFAAEAGRLRQLKMLTAEECGVLNLNNLAAFWNSDIGKQILARRDSVRRELPFTAGFDPRELDEILGSKSPGLENEFIVVQGIVDLAVLAPGEIWLVDFKTDDVRRADLPEKIKMYSPQLKLYARALENIYSRPVRNCWLHFLALQHTEKI
jgi:ATP-dependent helicase/nuclease subunit A